MSCLLIKVMEPVLRKLDESSFEILDQNMAWNAKKPVWFQVQNVPIKKLRDNFEFVKLFLDNVQRITPLR